MQFPLTPDQIELQRMVRDARMFTVAGGTVQLLRNVAANGFPPRVREGAS